MPINQAITGATEEGSLLPYMLPVIAVVSLLMITCHLLMKWIAPQSYESIGVRRIVNGYATMTLPVFIISLLLTDTFTTMVNEFLAAISITYTYTALVGVPLIVLLRRLKLLNFFWVLGVVTFVVSAFSLVDEIVNYGNLIGWKRWQASQINTIAYVAIMCTAFCIGARIRLFGTQ